MSSGSNDLKIVEYFRIGQESHQQGNDEEVCDGIFLMHALKWIAVVGWRLDHQVHQLVFPSFNGRTHKFHLSLQAYATEWM